MAYPVNNAHTVCKDTGWFEFLVDIELCDVFDLASVAKLGRNCDLFRLEDRELGPFFQQVSCLHLCEFILTQDVREALRNLPDLPWRVDHAPVIALHLDQEELVGNELDQFDSLKALVAHEGYFPTTRVQFEDKSVLSITMVLPSGYHELTMRVIDVEASRNFPLPFLNSVFECKVPRVLIFEI